MNILREKITDLPKVSKTERDKPLKYKAYELSKWVYLIAQNLGDQAFLAFYSKYKNVAIDSLCCYNIIESKESEDKTVTISILIPNVAKNKFLTEVGKIEPFSIKENKLRLKWYSEVIPLSTHSHIYISLGYTQKNQQIMCELIPAYLKFALKKING